MSLKNSAKTMVFSKLPKQSHLVNIDNIKLTGAIIVIQLTRLNQDDLYANYKVNIHVCNLYSLEILVTVCTCRMYHAIELI